jgi:hypothetical protein
LPSPAGRPGHAFELVGRLKSDSLPWHSRGCLKAVLCPAA